MRFWVALLLGVIAVAVVFFFSSQSYQKQTIQPYLKEHVKPETLMKVLPEMVVEYNGKRYSSVDNPYSFVEFVFRKSAHVFVYALVGMSCFAILRSMKRGALVATGGTVAWLVLVAALDEYNQRSSVNRTGTPRDLLFDLIGGCLGIMACLVVLMIRRSVQENRSSSGKK